MRKISHVVTAAVLVSLGVSLPAQLSAGTININVAGTAGPWNPSLNPAFDYGVHDQTQATAVTVIPGSTLSVAYISGTVASGVGASDFDANGGPSSFVTNTYNGVNGVFPAFYMDPAVNVYSTALVGTFANNGVIVGTPFLVGVGPKSLLAPAGANQLLLGINDNLYAGASPNTGSFLVSVNDGAVPEPSTVLLTATGLGVAVFGLRRRS
ncbi:MAG: PEP-CTERM sorting domain-containing protein [Bryobacterales bacterium]|nr:PEP-CTERM sorting domain-containing protein [Bryobacterales bacterium]